MKIKNRNKFSKNSNSHPQSVKITKVIITEQDSDNIIGSGYLIEKKNGEHRLDIKDMKDDAMKPGWYNVHQTKMSWIGFTSDLIQ